MLNGLRRTIRQLLGPGYADYVGGATFGDMVDILSCLRRGEPVLEGPEIRAYESALGDYHGADAVTFGAGNMALHAILKAMGLDDGAEIILPGYTCVVVPNAIRLAGLAPVYVDVSLDDFNLIPERVEAAITSKTGAILAQATFGIPCDMDALMDISRRTGVPVIEDGAHGIGARWRGRMLGEYGLAAFFSTQATKMFSTERGGYAITRDDALAGRLREIQAATPYYAASFERATIKRWCYRVLQGKPALNPRLRWLERFLRNRKRGRLVSILDHDADQYRDAVAGTPGEPYPARMGNLLSRMGRLQLERFEEDLERRRRLAEFLAERLPALGARVAQYDTGKADPSWVRFPFVVQDRQAWTACMKASGVAPGVWLNDPIHPRDSDRQKAGYQAGACPNGEYLSEHILNAPLHRGVSKRRLEKWLKRCSRLKLAPVQSG